MVVRRSANIFLAAVLVFPLSFLVKADIFPVAHAAGAPTVSSVSPNVGPGTGGTTVTITGTNFATTQGFSDISSGDANACGISADAKAYCWGSNSYGQLGNNSTTDSLVPVPVDTSGVLQGKKIKQISVDSRACVLTTDNGIYCWGYNPKGQLGNGTTGNSSVPVAVNTSGVLAGKTIKQVSVGGLSTCALDTAGKVYCWGDNMDGQLGNNSQTSSSIPVAVTTSGVLNGKTITQISSGAHSVCALDTGGKVYCWGSNYNGQLGINSVAPNSLTPASVDTNGALNSKTVKQVDAGYGYTCASTTANTIACWGTNYNGELGNGSTVSSSVPMNVDMSGALNGKTINTLAISGVPCATDSNGKAYCWGRNSYGQLGNGATDSNVFTPTAVSTSGALNGKTLASLSAGNAFVCATDTAYGAYCWGYNASGQLGNNSTTDSNSAAAVSNLPTATPTVSFGGTPAANAYLTDASHMTAITPAHADGLVNVTVTNPTGEAGTLTNGYRYGYPAPTITSITPDSGPSNGLTSVTVTGSNFVVGSSIMEVAAGNAHTCALTSENKLYCWGSNNFGQLGNGSASNSTIPVLADTSGALSGKTLTALSAGGNTSCALDSGGKAYCWGDNSYGQLGNNSTTPSVVPVAVDTSGVLNGKTLASISTSGASTCAVDTNGKAYCWGQNNGTGQLGDGTQTDSHVPVAVDTSGVLNGKTITKIAAGTTSACAVANDAHAYCWGSGSLGQLGNGTINDSPTPTAVTTSGVLNGKTVTDISVMGDRHACALTSEGKAYCWGSNVYGELGDNSGLTLSPNPVAVDTSGVLNGKTLTSVRAAGSNSCTVDTDGKAYCWGNGAVGQLGNASTSNSSVPVAVTTSGVLNGKTITTMDATLAHDCAITSDGHLYCWGYNNSGQLGNGLVDNSTIPVSPYSTDMVIEHTMLSFDGHDAGKIIVQDSSHITALTPAHAVGPVNVTVTNPDGKTASLTNGYTYNLTTQPPDAPTSLTALPNSANVDLSWSAPGNNGGSPITDYVIEYSNNGGSTWTTYTHTPSTATSASLSGLQPGTMYSFRVMAVNAAGPGPASNITTGSPSFLTVFSSGDVDLSVIPTTGTRMSNSSHTLTTTTNNSTGYALLLETTSPNRNLTNGTSTIIPAIGTYATPGTLATNQWGYRVDGGNFSGGPTTTETNVASSAFNWAGVPASGNPDTIHSTNSAAENDSLDVWYGMSADTSAESGSYTNTVLYTAVAN